MPGVMAMTIARGDDVEVEGLGAALVLRGIDAAEYEVRRRAGARFFMEGAADALGHGIGEEEFELEHLALGVDALAVLDRVAGLVEQLAGLAQERRSAPLPSDTGGR